MEPLGFGAAVHMPLKICEREGTDRVSLTERGDEMLEVKPDAVQRGFLQATVVLRSCWRSWNCASVTSDRSIAPPSSGALRHCR